MGNRYSLFIIDKEYEQGSLDDHIRYVRRHSGIVSIDSWDSTDSIVDAVESAKHSGLYIAIVDSLQDYSTIAIIGGVK